MKRWTQFAAFTLVEVLFSIVLLSLVTVLVARIMSSATLATSQSAKQMDSNSQVQAVFERMASDFAGIVKRQDVDYVFAKQNGNDTMYFFSEAAKYFDSSVSDSAKSSVSLVGYRVNSNFQLERLSRGLTWDGKVAPAPSSPGSMVFLTPSGSSTPLTARYYCWKLGCRGWDGSWLLQWYGYGLSRDWRPSLQIRNFVSANRWDDFDVGHVLQRTSKRFRSNCCPRHARYDKPRNCGARGPDNQPRWNSDGQCPTGFGGRHRATSNVEGKQLLNNQRYPTTSSLSAANL